MLLLIVGVLIWSGVHFLLALCPGVKAAVVARIGALAWKGLFALAIVAGLVLMVVGWQSSSPALLWVPPAAMRHATMVLVPIAMIFFFAARLPTDIRRYIRHPQLTGVKLWAAAHLLSNGELRSVILFGGLLAWAVLEVILINRRDGKAWKRPAVAGPLKTLVSTLIALVIAAALMHWHVYFTGVALI